MKILIVNSLYYPNLMGGTEKFSQLIAEGFANKGFKVIVVCIHPYKDNVNFYNGVKIYYLYHRNVYFRYKKKIFLDNILKPLNYLIDLYNPLIGKAFGRILKIEKPDIVHTNNIYGFSPIIWNKVKESKIPLVHTLHDYQTICARATMFKRHKLCKKQCLECKILTLTKKWLFKKIDYVVGISSYVLKKHLEFGMFKNTQKRAIFPNPLISDPISSPKTCVNAPLRFLYLGGIFDHKGFYFLINTFSKLEEVDNKYELWIGGRGEYKENINLNIKILGFINPEDIYPKIDVVIVPSLCNEAFGRIVIEAYSYGLPVIGSNRGGIPELISHGKTGFIFNPDNEDEFLKYIKMFIDNPDLVLKLSPNCLKYSENFKIDKILDAYIRLYKTLVIENA
jgi:glycosyltransferase involved in cell wall biosynthesis